MKIWDFITLLILSGGYAYEPNRMWFIVGIAIWIVQICARLKEEIHEKT